MLHERTLGCLWYVWYSKTEGTDLGGIELERSRQYFSSRGSLRPFKGSPRSRTSRGPLAHTFIRRNRSFSEVKNLATSLLIICQKEKNPVIFRKNRHALRSCGSAVFHIVSCAAFCLPGDSSCLCVICNIFTHV